MSIAVRPASRRRVVWTTVCAVPALTVVAIFVFIPLVALAIISGTEGAAGTELDGFFANYAHFLSSGYYLKVLWSTVRIAVEASVVSLILGYPIAIFLATHRGRAARVLVVLLLCPLFVSVAVRAYAWNVLLAPSGPLGWLDITFEEPAVVVGLVQYLLPFTVLSLTASLSAIEPSLARAARTLGSGAVAVFRTVTLPLSVPGVVSALVISFSMGMTAFAIPLLLGGGRTQVLVSLVYEQQMSVFNQGFAAAVSIIMLVITLVAIVATSWLSRRLQGAMG